MMCKVNDSENPFYGPFLSHLLDRVHFEGSTQQKIKLVQLACTYRYRWPQAQRQVLNDHLSRWLLDALVPAKSFEALFQVANQWSSEGNRKNDLTMALKAWQLLQKKDVTEALPPLQSFFSNWEDRISAGVDFSALRTMCAVQAFRNNPSYRMPSQASSNLHQELIQCALSILAREGVQRPYVVPNVDISKQEAQQLCRLYLGQQRNENDVQYLKRLSFFALANPSDLRKTRRVHEEAEEEMSDKYWMIPAMRPTRVKQMASVIQEEITALQARITHTLSIADEKPKYSDDALFIQWVKDKITLASDYFTDREKVKQEFYKTFPSFPKHARDAFFNDLNEKATHEQEYRSLLMNSPKPSKTMEERFWQLIRLTNQLIESVHANQRSDGNYNTALCNEGEARFIMLLIQEWSRNGWTGTHEEFTSSFHGPEIHLFGEGPRIRHFNAGVYKNGKLENVHLYFQ